MNHKKLASIQGGVSILDSLLNYTSHLANLGNFDPFYILKQSQNMCLSDHQIQAAILRRNPSSSNLGCKYMKHGSIDLNWFNICSDIYLQLLLTL